uniref:beta-ketoacyl synthase N-terminal-like domain-containing protein n=1 Tax=uncultured Legionella sp. TaxID=210934 RepID=UPI00261144EA
RCNYCTCSCVCIGLCQGWTWALLYEDEKPKKTGLPTYPFSKERYWLLSTPTLTKPAHSLENNEHQFSEQVVNFVRKIIAEATKIDISRIDAEANFEAYGIDSIMITRLNQALETHFGKLPTTLFFTYHTASELADYSIKNHTNTLQFLSDSNKTTNPLTQTMPETDTRHKTSTDIAIIGYSGQFPEAKNAIEYWENLKAGRNCITEIPESRWENKKYYEEIKDKCDITSGKIYCKWGGFIENTDTFDADLFHISPKDAVFMDPQERLFMQCVWSSIEASGYTPETLVKKGCSDQVGVFVGVSFNNYQLVCAEAMHNDNLVPVVDSQIFSVANRVSYFFNFHGPSIPLDTACSSSLYAAHLACESIQRGECSVAIAGATNLTLHPSKYATLCSGGFLASDGLCHAFGEGGARRRCGSRRVEVLRSSNTGWGLYLRCH